MSKLWWQTIGEGDIDLVLLHGWGLNAEVWRCITTELSSHYRLHLVDLPGYGRSQQYGAQSLHEMAQCVLAQAPERAIWLGWSMGGLIASHVAWSFPQRVSALVNVASSPCFSAQATWPGIAPGVLTDFQHQLSENFQRTVDRFLTLQTRGTPDAREDVRALKSVVLAQPMPTVNVLNCGLEILRTTDIREEVGALAMPMLRLYGYLDGLVPRKIVPLLDKKWPKSDSFIFSGAAHAPFISHADLFCQKLIEWISLLSFSPARKAK